MIFVLFFGLAIIGAMYGQSNSYAGLYRISSFVIGEVDVTYGVEVCLIIEQNNNPSVFVYGRGQFDSNDPLNGVLQWMTFADYNSSSGLYERATITNPETGEYLTVAGRITRTGNRVRIETLVYGEVSSTIDLIPVN